jgi:hypothetical protein
MYSDAAIYFYGYKVHKKVIALQPGRQKVRGGWDVKKETWRANNHRNEGG